MVADSKHGTAGTESRGILDDLTTEELEVFEDYCQDELLRLSRLKASLEMRLARLIDPSDTRAMRQADEDAKRLEGVNYVMNAIKVTWSYRHNTLDGFAKTVEAGLRTLGPATGQWVLMTFPPGVDAAWFARFEETTGMEEEEGEGWMVELAAWQSPVNSRDQVGLACPGRGTVTAYCPPAGYDASEDWLTYQRARGQGLSIEDAIQYLEDSHLLDKQQTAGESSHKIPLRGLETGTRESNERQR